MGGNVCHVLERDLALIVESHIIVPLCCPMRCCISATHHSSNACLMIHAVSMTKALASPKGP